MGKFFKLAARGRKRMVKKSVRTLFSQWLKKADRVGSKKGYKKFLAWQDGPYTKKMSQLIKKGKNREEAMKQLVTTIEPLF